MIVVRFVSSKDDARAVDALDFLALIAGWGSPCAGSCAADITGPVAGEEVSRQA